MNVDINETKPILINRGLKYNFGELGDYLGDSDLAQIRFFNEPFDMWQMLGFEDSETNNPVSINYWKFNLLFSRI